LVEDEINLATTLKVALSKLGIRVEHVTTLGEAKDRLKTNPPSLLLLDRTLPDGDGLSLCESIRSEFHGMILMLTARGEVKDRVQGLHAGADDYLPKPFSWAELEARICALFRRSAQAAALSNRASISSHNSAGDSASTAPSAWTIDPDRLRILKPARSSSRQSSGESIDIAGAQAALDWITLTPLEFKLAAHLISANGAIVTREDLLKDVWGFTLLPKTRTVDHFLGRLRKYFEENPEEPKHFLTVRGAGYRFERNATV
jgi:DNA-binding response OmpR family regulator